MYDICIDDDSKQHGLLYSEVCLVWYKGDTVIYVYGKNEAVIIMDVI